MSVRGKTYLTGRAIVVFFLFYNIYHRDWIKDNSIFRWERSFVPCFPEIAELVT